MADDHVAQPRKQQVVKWAARLGLIQYQDRMWTQLLRHDAGWSHGNREKNNQSPDSGHDALATTPTSGNLALCAANDYSLRLPSCPSASYRTDLWDNVP